MDRRPFWLILPAVALLVGAAFWSMRTLLGPVVATAALCYLLWPYRDAPVVRRLLIAVSLLAFVWILARARAIVYPALAALAVAFLLDPFVSRLHRRGISRALAALALMLPLIAAGLLVALVLVPALVDQARRLATELPQALETVSTWILTTLDPYLRGRGFGVLEEHLSEILPSTERILRGVVSGVGQFGRGVAAVVEVLSFLLLTPILAYYILVDFGRLRRALRPYVNDIWAERLDRLGEIFQESVGAWLKGQLLVAIIIAALSVGGFFLIGLPYALLLGCLAGLLNLVPVLGFWVAFLLAAAAALFAPAPLPMLGKTVVVLLVIQALETNLLSPRIVGRQLGVKPVILLLTMLTLSVFLGVLGVLLAAPVIGLARGVWILWGPEPYRPDLLEVEGDG